MAALFVAIFLFFLSVALIWTNRQDIALSLSMEHKMKAQAAAESGAMYAYASLRAHGEATLNLDKELASGASWHVEFARKPAKDKRGEVLLVRSRGTSGPVTAYYTLHLLEVALGDDTQGDGQLIAFPGSSEGVDPNTPAEAGETEALFGDFRLQGMGAELPAALPGTLVAQQGPIYHSESAPAQYPLYPVDHIPVFTPIGQVMGFGPVVIAAPKVEDATQVKVLEYQGEAFQWKELPDLTSLGAQKPDLSSGEVTQYLELKGRPEWTNMATRSVGEGGNFFAWNDIEPATNSVEEATELASLGTFAVDLKDTKEWSEVPDLEPQEAFVLRGSLAARGNTVYSHAWHYLHRQYSGDPVSGLVPEHLGASLTRWPCIVSHTKGDSGWRKVWTPLEASGDVQTPHRPNPDVLLAAIGEDRLYSVTEKEPYRLLQLSGKNGAQLGVQLSSPNIFLYRDQPFAYSEDPDSPGFVNLVDQSRITFGSLPTVIPEIFGPVRVEDEEPSVPRTTRPEYLLNYWVDSNSRVAVEGDSLYVKVQIKVIASDPTFELLGDMEIAPGTRSVLGRYDGERWHIMPSGLRAALKNSLSAPSGSEQMIVARYPGLPSSLKRYAIISVETTPF